MAPIESTGTVPQKDPPVGVTKITLETAKALYKEYQSSPDIPTVPPRGVFFDLKQLEAMKVLLEENPKLEGFRIFFGKETGGPRVGIVVGVESGKDLVTASIYKTESPTTGMCPPVCDKESPIVKD